MLVAINVNYNEFSMLAAKVSSVIYVRGMSYLTSKYIRTQCI